MLDSCIKLFINITLLMTVFKLYVIVGHSNGGKGLCKRILSNKSNNENLQSLYQQSSLLPILSKQNHDRNQNSEAEQMIESELQRQRSNTLSYLQLLV